MHFGVLGAGVVGLTTALELQREFPNAQVTILAEKFLRDTTSDVAAGIFRPSTSFSGPNEEITR
jgi:D-aspartate oxidase